MSEDKHCRSPQEIQNEYGQLCMQIGDQVIKQKGGDSVIEQIVQKVKQLNVELAESNAYYARLNAELEAKKAEAPAS